MRFHFKISERSIKNIREDLDRSHQFAWERVGFLRVGLAAGVGETLLLAGAYRAVPDDQYRKHPTAGVSIGSDAIREALEWADGWRGGIFHIHAHRGSGIPRFSGMDIESNARLIPSFFNIAPTGIHGAIVLSDDRLAGAVWTGRLHPPKAIDRTTVIGAPLRSWWFR
jgi:hypothetical protein